MRVDGWYIVGESRDLKNKPLAVTLNEAELVLFRNTENKAVGLLDRCPHRNVQLSRGKVRNGCLQCPYHGWEFDGSGKCVYIPSLLEEQHIPAGTSAHQVPVVEQQGYLWAWSAERLPLPHEKPFMLPHYNEPGWGHGRLTSQIHNSVDNVIENFIDCPHTGYVHGGLFRSPASHRASSQVQAVPDGVIIDIDEENKTNGFLGKLLVKKGSKVTHQDRFIAPSIVQVAYGFGPGREIIGYQICTPVSPLETRIYVYVTYQMGLLNPLVHLGIPLFGWVILAQDVDILNNQGHVIGKHGEQFSSVTADTANLWIKACRSRLSKGEAPPSDRDKQVDYRL